MGFFDKKDKEVISPIEFVNEGNIASSPIGFIEKDVNTATNFAILRTTQNGKYVRNNMLFYNMNGVEVYTDINNIIFVDTVNKTLFIKEYDKVAKEINPEDPEQKQYYLLYVDIGYENSEEEFPLRWEAVIGRTRAYENIVVNAPVIDIDKSIIVVETVTLKESLTIRQFVDYLKNAELIEDDGFNINQYSGSEYI